MADRLRDQREKLAHATQGAMGLAGDTTSPAKEYNQVEDLQYQIKSLQARIEEQEHELLNCYRVITRNYVGNLG